MKTKVVDRKPSDGCLVKVKNLDSTSIVYHLLGMIMKVIEVEFNKSNVYVISANDEIADVNKQVYYLFRSEYEVVEQIPEKKVTTIEELLNLTQNCDYEGGDGLFEGIERMLKDNKISCSLRSVAIISSCLHRLNTLERNQQG